MTQSASYERFEQLRPLLRSDGDRETYIDMSSIEVDRSSNSVTCGRGRPKSEKGHLQEELTTAVTSEELRISARAV